MAASVLIAESNKFFLEALQDTLSLMGFNVVATTTRLSEIRTLALKTRPDLLLLDFHLTDRGMAGLADTRQIKEQLPEMKILVLGYYEATDRFAEEILNAGFDGSWNKFGNRAGFLEKLKLLFP